MNKSESKYYNTACLMDEALIDLLGKKDFQFITVKEICQKAGVNRSTFYLHYETISDLLNETIEHILEEFINGYSINAKEFIEGINEVPLEELVLMGNEYLRPYLQFVKDHKKVFKAAVNNPSSMETNLQLGSLYKYVLKPIFSRFGIPEEEHKYWLTYHIKGIMAIVQEWVQNDCLESVDTITRIIQNCVRPGKYRLVKDENAIKE